MASQSNQHPMMKFFEEVIDGGGEWNFAYKEGTFLVELTDPLGNKYHGEDADSLDAAVKSAIESVPAPETVEEEKKLIITL